MKSIILGALLAVAAGFGAWYVISKPLFSPEEAKLIADSYNAKSEKRLAKEVKAREKLYVIMGVPAFNGALIEVEDSVGKKSADIFPYKNPRYNNGRRFADLSNLTIPQPGNLSLGFTVRVNGIGTEGGHKATFRVPAGALAVSALYTAWLDVDEKCNAAFTIYSSTPPDHKLRTVDETVNFRGTDFLCNSKKR